MKLYRVTLNGGLYYVEAHSPEQAIKKAQTAARRDALNPYQRAFRGCEHLGEVLR